jgi:hypothetical protein
MESLILEGLGFLENLDFMVLLRILGVFYGVFWLFVVGWVWFDASDRYKSIWLRILMTFMVLTLNILGFLIYLVLRPKVSLEDSYWIDLERKYLKFEAAGLEDCPRCGEDVLPNFIHCPNCGKELRVKCESCDVYLEPDWNVCPFCGTKQKDIEFAKIKKKDKLKKKKKSEKVPLIKKVVMGYDGLIKFLGGNQKGKKGNSKKNSKAKQRNKAAKKKSDDKKGSDKKTSNKENSAKKDDQNNTDKGEKNSKTSSEANSPKRLTKQASKQSNTQPDSNKKPQKKQNDKAQEEKRDEKS